MARLTEAVAAMLAGWLRWPVLALLNRFDRRPVTASGSGLAVSLTSYGSRLRHVHLVVESIARGRTRPELLVLWLSEEEASGPLSPGLERLRSRGLCVRSCPDLGSHKKYFPFAQSVEATTLDLVTADDDVFYPRDWLLGLREGLQRQEVVWCYRARTMVMDGDQVAPYRVWPLSRSLGPSFSLVPTGVSGVAYPRAVVAALRERGDGFLRTAPSADDLWLHSTAVRNGVPVRQVAARRHFAISPRVHGPALMAENIARVNDEVVATLYDVGLLHSIRDDEGWRP